MTLDTKSVLVSVEVNPVNEDVTPDPVTRSAKDVGAPDAEIEEMFAPSIVG
jgi:hypothetical protein